MHDYDDIDTWFAVDRNGRLGVFDSERGGAIPDTNYSLIRCLELDCDELHFVFEHVLAPWFADRDFDRHSVESGGGYAVFATEALAENAEGALKASDWQVGTFNPAVLEGGKYGVGAEQQAEVALQDGFVGFAPNLFEVAQHPLSPLVSFAHAGHASAGQYERRTTGLAAEFVLDVTLEDGDWKPLAGLLQFDVDFLEASTVDLFEQVDSGRCKLPPAEPAATLGFFRRVTSLFSSK